MTDRLTDVDDGEIQAFARLQLRRSHAVSLLPEDHPLRAKIAPLTAVFSDVAFMAKASRVLGVYVSAADVHAMPDDIRRMVVAWHDEESKHQERQARKRS